MFYRTQSYFIRGVAHTGGVNRFVHTSRCGRVLHTESYLKFLSAGLRHPHTELGILVPLSITIKRDVCVYFLFRSRGKTLI